MKFGEFMKKLIVFIVILFITIIALPQNICALTDNEIAISTADELVAFSEFVNEHSTSNFNTDNRYYYLTCDIDLTQTLSPNGFGYELWGESGFKPIGYKLLNYERIFTGIFDGKGHTISGLWINRDLDNDNSDYMQYAVLGNGLFGYNKGTIKNLTIKASDFGITGYKNVGGIAGINEGNIENCSFFGNLSGFTVGGIAGYTESSTIKNSLYKGIIESSGNAGGISAKTYDSTIENVYVEASITADIAGGLTSYSLGRNLIRNSLSISNIIADEDYLGGLIGISEEQLDIENCYYINKDNLTYALNGIDDTNNVKGLNTNEILNKVYELFSNQTELFNLNKKIEYQKSGTSNYFAEYPTEIGDYTIRIIYDNNYFKLEMFGALTIEALPDNFNYVIIYICIVLIIILIILLIIFLFKLKLKQNIITHSNNYRDLPDDFSKREKQIAILMLDGLKRKEIANKLFLSENTVKTHTSNILRKSNSIDQKNFIDKYHNKK